MRVSIGLSESPRQYAPACESSLNALIGAVVCRCGPRHRSSKPSWTVEADVAVGEALDQLELVRLVLGPEAVDQLLLVDAVLAPELGADAAGSGASPPRSGAGRRPRSAPGSRSRSRSRRRWPGRSRSSRPATGAGRPAAITCAVEWRSTASASGSRSVRIRTFSPSCDRQPQVARLAVDLHGNGGLAPAGDRSPRPRRARSRRRRDPARVPSGRSTFIAPQAYKSPPRLRPRAVSRWYARADDSMTAALAIALGIARRTAVRRAP